MRTSYDAVAGKVGQLRESKMESMYDVGIGDWRPILLLPMGSSQGRNLDYCSVVIPDNDCVVKDWANKSL